MIDWNRIAELRDELGEDDFDEIFEVFLEEVADSVGQLASAQAPPDLEAVMHSLKGNALTVGFASLAEHAAEGERRAAAGQTADTAAVAQCYEQSLERYQTGP